MIGYIEGKLLKKDEDRILLLAGQVGYEIILPVFVMESLKEKSIGDSLSLYIYYQQTERQPRPILIGFNSEFEKEFFQAFITVDDMGPMKAVKALNIPVGEIADAIESKDIKRLKQLKGIGDRMAQKVIAALSGRMDKFISEPYVEKNINDTLSQTVLDVLVNQLGYKPVEAKQMIKDAIERDNSISTPEELFKLILYNPL